MTAPCIVRLDRAVAETSNDLVKSYLLAEKACYLTRIGEYAEADRIRSELRHGFVGERDLKASVLVMLLEGLQSYYKNLGVDAKDRLIRAQFLSKMAKNRELTAITSAWLSHMQFHDGNIADALKNIKLATETIEVGQWAALGRLSSVLGDIFMTVGNLPAARQWYSQARYAAVSYGDQAALGAITYNQAAFRVFDIRIKSSLGLPYDREALALAHAEIKSACNHQIAAGVTSLNYLLVSVQAGVHMILEQYSDALALLSELLREGEVPETYPYKSVLEADAVLCGAILARHEDTHRYLLDLLRSDLARLPLDDQIVIFSTLNTAVAHAPGVFEGHYSHVDILPMAKHLSAQREELAPLLEHFREVPHALRWQLNEA